MLGMTNAGSEYIIRCYMIQIFTLGIGFVFSRYLSYIYYLLIILLGILFAMDWVLFNNVAYLKSKL